MPKLWSRQTYDWDSECHAIEGEGGQRHDDGNNPIIVSESSFSLSL